MNRLSPLLAYVLRLFEEHEQDEHDEIDETTTMH